MKKTCPICNGEGVVHPSHYEAWAKTKVAKTITARRLKKDGYSIREIAKMLHYKSPQSVQKLLKIKTT